MVKKAAPQKNSAAKSSPEQTKPSWRHYNFTTAGPVDDYLYSMLPKRDAVLAEFARQIGHLIERFGPALKNPTAKLSRAHRWLGLGLKPS